MADRNTKIRGDQIFDGGVDLNDMADSPKIASISYVIDGGGSVINTGVVGEIHVPFKSEIIEVSLLTDITGSIQIDLWKDSFVNYPPTIVNTITASALPEIISGMTISNSALVGWTKIINVGDVIIYNVNSVTSVKRCLVTLKVKKIL